MKIPTPQQTSVLRLVEDGYEGLASAAAVLGVTRCRVHQQLHRLRAHGWLAQVGAKEWMVTADGKAALTLGTRVARLAR